MKSIKRSITIKVVRLMTEGLINLVLLQRVPTSEQLDDELTKPPGQLRRFWDILPQYSRTI